MIQVATLKILEDKRNQIVRCERCGTLTEARHTRLGHFYGYDNRLELVCKNCYQKEQSMLGE